MQTRPHHPCMMHLHGGLQLCFELVLHLRFSSLPHSYILLNAGTVQRQTGRWASRWGCCILQAACFGCGCGCRSYGAKIAGGLLAVRCSLFAANACCVCRCQVRLQHASLLCVGCIYPRCLRRAASGPRAFVVSITADTANSNPQISTST